MSTGRCDRQCDRLDQNVDPALALILLPGPITTDDTQIKPRKIVTNDMPQPSCQFLDAIVAVLWPIVVDVRGDERLAAFHHL